MCNQAGCGACVVTAEMKDPNGVDGWKTKSVNTVSWFEQFCLYLQELFWLSSKIISHMLC